MPGNGTGAVWSGRSTRHANEAITDADWKRVFESEGYVRLKKRETSMHARLKTPNSKRLRRVCFERQNSVSAAPKARNMKARGKREARRPWDRTTRR